jgi:imidazolonepropionase-like amidohydrolase
MAKSFSKTLLLVAFILIPCGTGFANSSIPGAASPVPIALVGGTIYPVTSPPIFEGVLVISEGRIVSLGKQANIPNEAKVIDVKGRSIYPGLFNTDGLIGLMEVNSVRATRDYRETGRINPNARAEVAVNPDSELIPVTRSGGVLLNLTTPTGGLVSGTSAVLQMDGWTWEEMTLKAPAGLHIHWPNVRVASSESNDNNQAEKEALEELRKLFDEARAYFELKKSDTDAGVDLRLEALKPVLDRAIPLVVSADRAMEIQAAVAFAAEQSVRLIIYGGYDAETCAALLKQHEVPVVISGVHRLPMRRGEAYDTPFTLPNRLRLAGVDYCLAASDRFDGPNVRNLPHQAGHAVAFGLPRLEALKAITIYPAEIFGIADRVGSLEVGKDATLIITDGDPLETATRVEAAFIQGRPVDLSDKHKILWKKYRERLRRNGFVGE